MTEQPTPFEQWLQDNQEQFTGTVVTRAGGTVVMGDEQAANHIREVIRQSVLFSLSRGLGEEYPPEVIANLKRVVGIE